MSDNNYSETDKVYLHQSDSNNTNRPGITAGDYYLDGEYVCVRDQQGELLVCDMRPEHENDTTVWEISGAQVNAIGLEIVSALNLSQKYGSLKEMEERLIRAEESCKENLGFALMYAEAKQSISPLEKEKKELRKYLTLMKESFSGIDPKDLTRQESALIQRINAALQTE